MYFIKVKIPFVNVETIPHITHFSQFFSSDPIFANKVMRRNSLFFTLHFSPVICASYGASFPLLFTRLHPVAIILYPIVSMQ